MLVISICHRLKQILEGFIMTEEKIEYNEKARKVLQAIMNAKRNDDSKTILVTYNKKQFRVINIEKDLGNLENARFNPMHPSIIIFETDFKLFAKKIESINVISVGKKIFYEF